jgi:hypothetical protein
MPITVICDECSETHRVRDEAAGKRFKCKGCGKSLLVESPVETDDDDLDDEDEEEDEEPRYRKRSPRRAKPAASRKKKSRKGSPVRLRDTLVPAGINIVFAGFVVFALVIFCHFFAEILLRSQRISFQTLFDIVRALYYLNYVALAANVIAAVGMVLCLTAPLQTTGKVVIIAATLIDLLSLGIQIAPLCNVAVPPLLSASNHLITVIAFVGFVVFLRLLGDHMGDGEIVERSNDVLLWSGVAIGLWVMIIILLIVFPGGGTRVVAGLLSLVLLGLSAFALFRYAQLLVACRNAVSGS